MNIFYFFQKYLNKSNEIEFRIKWEKFVHNHINRFITIMIVIWLFLSVGVGYLLNLVVGPFIGFLLMVIFSIYLGYILFIQTIKFLAVNNSRYIEEKMNQDESIIDYDNVVG